MLKVSKVYVTDYMEDLTVEKKILGGYLSADAHENIEVLLVFKKKINENYLSSYPNLKAVVQYGVGYDNNDLELLKKRNIMLCNTPDYGTDEVADTTFAMILNIIRGISKYDFNSRHFTNNTWQINTIKMIKRTSEIKLGVIGAGNIGGSVLKKAHNFGIKTFFYDPYVKSGYDKLLNSERIYNLDNLLSKCDVISINTPLTDETKGMVNKNFISLMKNTGSIVLTARGEIIDNLDTIYDALKNDEIDSCALDVLPEEPPMDCNMIRAWKNREMWLAGRLLINPHTAFYSKESIIEMKTKAAENALRIIEGQRPLNRII